MGSDKGLLSRSQTLNKQCFEGCTVESDNTKLISPHYKRSVTPSNRSFLLYFKWKSLRR